MKQVGPTTAYTETGLNQYDVWFIDHVLRCQRKSHGDGVLTYAMMKRSVSSAAGNGTTAVYAYDPSGEDVPRQSMAR